jgi:hypothetical protein
MFGGGLIETDSLDDLSYIATSVPNLDICHPTTKRANMVTRSGQYRWTLKD